jgi:hypothetical protein
MTTLHTPNKVDFHVALPQAQKELFEYMLQKADLDASEAVEAFIAHWINQNTDLLSAQDVERFGNLFFTSKKA